MGESKTRKSKTRPRRKTPAPKAPRTAAAKPIASDSKKSKRSRSVARSAADVEAVNSVVPAPESPETIDLATLEAPVTDNDLSQAIDDPGSVNDAPTIDDTPSPLGAEEIATASGTWASETFTDDKDAGAERDALDTDDDVTLAAKHIQHDEASSFEERLALQETERDGATELPSLDLTAPALPAEPRRLERLAEQPLPRITIHASCDRPEIAELIAGISADRRMTRAEITIEGGGIDAAISRFASYASPNLLILDSTLPKDELLAALDRLADVTEPGAKVILIGAVNDIGLFRELMTRGVSEYIVPPMQALDLIRAVCGLYVSPEKPFAGRVIAVIGARGGIGASTIAHNLAWSIAERHDAGATLLDLDLSFGTAALDFNQDPQQSIADVLMAADRVDDVFLDRIATKQTQRLQILTAPATLEQDFELGAHAFDAVIDRARSAAPFVVLDLPNVWSLWVKQTLISADDVIVIASPDLASLRNTKNIIDLLKVARRYDAPPTVALSMVGMPKRPEIPLKEFAEAVGAEPLVSFAFDPALFGMAANNGQMIGEIAPQSRAAQAIDTLAASLTGRRKTEVKASSLVERLQALGVAADDVSSAVRRQFEGLGKHWPARALIRHPEISQIGLDLSEPSEAQRDAIAAADCAPALASAGDYLARARKAAQAQMSPESETSKAQAQGVRDRLVAIGAVGTIALLVSAGYQTLSGGDSAMRPQAAQAGTISEQDPRAQYDLAIQLIADRRTEEAIALLERAASEGFALAQYRLAKLYERGEGVAADLTLARLWTERAAASGNRRAMHDLGVYFARGEGAPLDEAAAFRWFRQAAELGVADSQYNLGILYEQGRGVALSASEALFWFLVAAGQGDRDAASRAAALASQLPPAQIEQAQARAQAFRPRAADTIANGEFDEREASPRSET